MIPEAEVFGFRAQGELFRRLRDFSQTDAEAHWIYWIDEGRRRRLELRVLREQGGAMLEVEVDRQLRRLRILERPRSTVVRKRRHVFVDTHAQRARDRFFSTTERLDEAARQQMRKLIDEGYRIIYEKMVSDQEVEERGRRPDRDLAANE